MDSPVETGHAIIALDPRALNHDVVTGFAIVVGVVTLTVEDIVTDNGTVEEQLRVVTRQRVKPVAAFQPVIAFVAHQEITTRAAKRKVVILTREDLLRIFADHHEVATAATKDQIVSVTGEDNVMSGITVQEVRITNRRTGIGNNVITVTTMDHVCFVAAVQSVISAITPQTVDPFTAD